MPLPLQQIGAIDAGRHGADQHLPAPGLVDLDRLDGQLLMHLAEDGGFDFHIAPTWKLHATGVV